jgi:hypothetical protein
MVIRGPKSEFTLTALAAEEAKSTNRAVTRRDISVKVRGIVYLSFLVAWFREPSLITHSSATSNLTPASIPEFS